MLKSSDAEYVGARMETTRIRAVLLRVDVSWKKQKQMLRDQI